jgi:hypothetical protein
MPKLPRASGDKHFSAFKVAGWQVNDIEGNNYILTKRTVRSIYQYLCIRIKPLELVC